jgi:hypothetical protein
MYQSNKAVGLGIRQSASKKIVFSDRAASAPGIRAVNPGASPGSLIFAMLTVLSPRPAYVSISAGGSFGGKLFITRISSSEYGPV